MKSLALENYGVQEMSYQERASVNGGQRLTCSFELLMSFINAALEQCAGVNLTFTNEGNDTWEVSGSTRCRQDF